MAAVARSATRTRLMFPLAFLGWVAAAVVSTTANMAALFVLTWVASGYGGHVAGTVAAVGTLSRIAVLPFGGLAGDRFGVRLLLAADAVMGVTMLVTAGLLAAGTVQPTPVALGLLAAAGGLTSGFSIPATAVLPRLFFADADLPRALALVGSALQLARIVGAPAGGLLFGGGLPLAAVLGLNAAGFALLACACGVVLRSRGARPGDRATVPRHTNAPGQAELDHQADEAGALQLLGRMPLLRVLLLGTTLLAGGVLPAMYVGAPLLVRSRSWSASVAGLIEAGWVSGGLAVSLFVAARGAARRAGVPMAVSPLVVAVGLVALAFAPLPWLTVAASVVVGAGVVGYTVHAFPMYLATTPARLAARLQSVLVGVQSVAMAACGYGVGWLAATFSPATAVLAAAGVAASTAGVGALSRVSRTATMPS